MVLPFTGPFSCVPNSLLYFILQYFKDKVWIELILLTGPHKIQKGIEKDTTSGSCETSSKSDTENHRKCYLAAIYLESHVCSGEGRTKSCWTCCLQRSMCKRDTLKQYWVRTSMTPRDSKIDKLFEPLSQNPLPQSSRLNL